MINNNISAQISDRNSEGILLIASFNSAVIILVFILLKRILMIPMNEIFNVVSLYLDTQGKFGQDDSVISVAKR